MRFDVVVRRDEDDYYVATVQSFLVVIHRPKALMI